MTKPRLARRPICTALIGAVVLMMALTTNASAEHDDPVKRGPSCDVTVLSPGPKVLGPGPRGVAHGIKGMAYGAIFGSRGTASCELPGYQQGQRAGAATGWADGQRHGRAGCTFSPQPRQGLQPFPIAYRQGFKAGYRDAYERGYAAGRRAREQVATCGPWLRSWLFTLR